MHADARDRFEAEREEMTETTHELQRELKLRQMIIEHFIPALEVEKIQRRARYDEEYAPPQERRKERRRRRCCRHFKQLWRFLFRRWRGALLS